MNTRQLETRMSRERQEALLRQPLWRPAAERGLTWLEAVKDRDCAASAINGLPAYASTALKTILLRLGAEAVTEEKLLQTLREHTGMAGAECRIAIRGLERAGFLVAVQKLWGERLYGVPADCYAVWLGVLLPVQLAPAASRARSAAEGSPKEPFGRRLLYAMAALAKADSSYTAKGLLPKKTAARLDEALQLDESRLNAFPLEWMHKEHYSLGTAFALTACSELGLLSKGEDRLELDMRRLGIWSAMTEEQRERELQDWVCSVLFRLVGAEALAAGVLLNAPTEEWCSVQQAETLLAEADAASTTMPSWTRLFHELGWMELGLADTDPCESLFKRRRFSSASDTEPIMVQPNGDIWVPPGCRYTIRWELELLGERQNAEEPVLYRLTQAAVSNALEQGRTREGLEQFLAEASGEESCSLHVQSLLREWTDKACRFAFQAVTLLRCDSQEMARHVKAIKEVYGLPLQEIGGLDFIVPGDSVTEIRRLLQKSGYPPRKGVIGVSGSPAARPSYPPLPHTDGDSAPIPPSEPSIRLLLEPIALHQYGLVQEETEVVLLPGIEQVPAAWWNEMRSYHDSTRKAFMQQAVALQTAVQLRLNGELQAFVPEQVEQRGREWAVTGRMVSGDRPEKSRLTPDMWEEMRLLLPNGLST